MTHYINIFSNRKISSWQCTNDAIATVKALKLTEVILTLQLHPKSLSVDEWVTGNYNISSKTGTESS